MALLHRLNELGAQPVALPTRPEVRSAARPDPGIVLRASAPTATAAAAIPDTPENLPADYLKRVLDHADSTPEHSRLGRGNYVHVSTLVDMCPRQYFLAHQHGNEDYLRHLGENWTGGHLVTFAMGRGAEAHVKGQVLRMLREQVYGMWRCRCRRTQRMGMYTPSLCPHCRFDTDVYVEPVLRNEEYRIIGRPDITIVDRNRHVVVVEIKTMARDHWAALTAPRPDHVLQGLLYWWLYLRAGRRMNSRIVFIYITKDFRYGSPYKEFHVDAYDPFARTSLDLALAMAMQLRQASDEGRPPPRVLCANAESTRARNCPLRTLCFSME